jgi:hypothetical protein
MAPDFYATSTEFYIEGRLTTAAGAYLQAGTYSIKFNIYGSDTATTPLWYDIFDSVSVGSGGMFNVTLGSQKALVKLILYPEKPALPNRVSLFGYNTRWLEVMVDGEVFGQRIRIDPSSYAANADALDGADSTKFALQTKVSALQARIAKLD